MIQPLHSLKVKSAIVAAAACMAFTAPSITAFAAEPTAIETIANDQRAKQDVIQNLEKVDLHSIFDAAYYAKMNPQLVAILGNDPEALYRHFIEFGIKENRPFNPSISTKEVSYALNALKPVLGDNNKLYLAYLVNAIEAKTTGKIESNTILATLPATTVPVINQIVTSNEPVKIDKIETVLATVAETGRSVEKEVIAQQTPAPVEEEQKEVKAEEPKSEVEEVHKEIKKEVSKAEKAYIRLDKALKNYKAIKTQLFDAENAASVAKDKYDAALRGVESQNAVCEDQAALLDEAKTQFNTAESKKEEAREALEAAQSELTTLANEVASLSKSFQEVSATLQAKTDAYNEAVAAGEDVIDETLAGQLEEAESDLERFKTDLQEIEDQLRGAQSELDDANESLSSLRDRQQEIKEEQETLYRDYNDQVNDKTFTVNETREAIAALDKQMKDLEPIINDADTVTDDEKKDATDFLALLEQIEASEDDEWKASQAETLSAFVAKFDADTTDQATAKENAQAVLTKRTAAEVAEANETYLSLSEQKAEKESAADELDGEIQNLIETRDKTWEPLEQIKGEVEAAEKDAEEAQGTVDKYASEKTAQEKVVSEQQGKVDKLTAAVGASNDAKKAIEEANNALVETQNAFNSLEKQETEKSKAKSEKEAEVTEKQATYDNAAKNAEEKQTAVSTAEQALSNAEQTLAELQNTANNAQTVLENANATVESLQAQTADANEEINQAVHEAIENGVDPDKVFEANGFVVEKE